MLLTINGEADNGKDYVADYLCKNLDLVKISLADPMKRFVRQLFGFPADNLWGASEKRNELLDAQPLWNAAFTQLHTMHQFTAAVVSESLGPDVRARAFDGLQTWFTTLRRQNPEKLSARVVLQTLGTEWGRETYPNLWIDYLFNVQLPLLAQGYSYRYDLGVILNDGLEDGERHVRRGICIPDQRFENELEAFESRGGTTLRVRRLSRVRRDGGNTGITGHKSELEQRGIPDERFSKVFNFEEGLDHVNAQLDEWLKPICGVI